MDKRAEIELIKLEVLGCISETEFDDLSRMRESNEDFPWKVLAEYQNLAALLPTTLIAEKPSSYAKENMVRKLNRSIFKEETDNELHIIDLPKENPVVKPKVEPSSKGKIDWGSLTVIDSSPTDISSFKEVKTKKHLTSSISEQSNQTTNLTESEEPAEINQDQKEIISKMIPMASKNLRKYVFASVGIFIVSAFIFGYLLINNISEVAEVKAEILKPGDSNPVALENVIIDSLVQFADLKNDIKVKTEEAKKEEPKKEVLNEQNILPKAPPKLPDPIEAPLVELTKDSPQEDIKSEEEISYPPPKEIEEINEEPTYFIAVEEMPEPVGGIQEIQSRIEYPEIAKRAGIEGKVFVRAYVDETGTVTSAEIVKGIGGGCDEAALDAVLKTKFNPGKQRGKPIKVQVTIPIVFKR